MTWLSVTLTIAPLLASCDVPARITQGPALSWIQPNAGPELFAVPVGDLSVIMEPGPATQKDIDAALSPERGYVSGSGIHLATYPDPSRVDIYTIVILPAGGVACAAWKQHPLLPVAVLHRDGTAVSEVVAP